MLVVLFVNIFAIFFAFLESNKIIKNGLVISFLIIFIFLALRYDYGNDYGMYITGFDIINSSQYLDIFSESIHFEPGWVVLCMLFKPVGFFVMVAVLSFLYCILFYKLIRDYVPVHLYWLAMFIFVFSTNNLLVHLSAMRQTLVILIFIYSFRFIFQKKLILYFVTIFFASLFHTSALILLPVYFLRFVNFKMNKWVGGFIILFYILLFIIGQQLRPLINIIIASLHENYLLYDEEGVISTGLGLVLNSFVFILILNNDKNYEGEKSFLFKLAIISFLLTPLGLIIMLIGRVQLYFSLFLIVVFPLVYDSIQHRFLKYVFLFILVLLNLFTFFEFFRSPIWIDKFAVYHSIFSYF